MYPPIRVEICADSVEGARAAARGGADRVELCGNLLEGGTTPSLGCIRCARQNLKMPLHVMIRPRGGDFLYNEMEQDVMRQDIEAAKEAGADGVVFGCLAASGDVDVSLTRDLIQHARPMSVTFHRAFDMCRDPHMALNELISLGVDRLLTSGQEASCLEGLELIGELQRLAAGRIAILPGGGITLRNVARIVRETGVTEVHLSARRSVESEMIHRNSRCFMGGALRPPEYSWKVTDEAAVRAVVDRLNAI